ncbi:MAG: hypothetical protein KJN98_06750, partial [Pontiella sp.]|nr:hypothetical protein [Pontiella sp.]
IMLRIRPNDTYAKLLFTQTYEGVQVQLIRSSDGPSPDPDSPVGYKISYLKDGQSNEFKLIFRRTVNGDWIPQPPLPEALPPTLANSSL